MKTCKIILLLFCLLFIAATGKAQHIERFNTFTYSVNEGLLQSTIGDMAFDKNNFCWISFPNGVQKFDGNNFTVVPVQPGLPDDQFVSFLSCSNGDLLLSHALGISKYDVNNNKFVHVFKSGPSAHKRVIFIGEDEEVVYFYTGEGEIISLDTKTYKVIKVNTTGLPDYASHTDYRPTISSNIIGHRFALLIKSRLYLWDLKKEKLISRSDSIPRISAFFLTLKNGEQVYYYTNTVNSGIFSYDFRSRANTLHVVKGKDKSRIGRCLIFPWKNDLLISFNNHIYKTDTAVKELTTEIVNFQNDPVSGSQDISGIEEDNYGNLFIRTISGGIRKIIRNNFPLKYYGAKAKEESYILSILPDKINNRVLAGTSDNGLLVFDTQQHLIKHIKTLPGANVSFSANNIIKDKGGNYLLFNISEKNVWRISKDLSSATPVKISSSIDKEKRGIYYFGNFLFQDEKQAILQSQGRLYRADFTNNTFTEHEFTSSYTMGGLWYDNMIISHANDELIFMDGITFNIQKKITFKNTGYVRCFARDAENGIYLGCNKGIFKIDITGKIVFHLTKESGLPDECIYAMAFDENGALWCSTNKGIFKLDKKNNILQITKADGLQENEFNTNVVAKSPDGEMFFGGVNGVSSFYPNAISNFEERINLLLTQVKVNNKEVLKDTAVWAIDKIDLPYDQNSLSFDFIAMANNNPRQYIYQYMMEGVDKEWIQNSDLQSVRYFLPPGEYTFKMYASRFFDKDAKSMKEIRIIIHPPFWKAWWFISGIILLVIAGLAYAISRYSKRKYQKRLAALESEYKIQIERQRISRDLHDSIGAYANAVLYNTELLEKENNAEEKSSLMNDLKFASKDIITSLRETVWALKKDNYTAEECWIRVKNFMQALSRYYPQIQFKTDGDASSQMVLHHTKALHIVRIVQEAVTNAVKHAGAGTVDLSSRQKDGIWELTVTDNGKGFDYEGIKNNGTGNGLVNMGQRAAESGIEFTVDSFTGSGTKITLLV